MVNVDTMKSPVGFLAEGLRELSDEKALREYEGWWKLEGEAISDAVDRAGTPWLRMFDKSGNRVDEIVFIPDYWRMLRKGYEEGVIWRAFEGQSLRASFEMMYVVGFYDPGLACPYTVSLSTALPMAKYGDDEVKQRFLPQMLKRDGSAWQGATWMTEIRGGSDLGAGVETVARREGNSWVLTGEKYFCSNAGAELAVVAAHIDGAPQGVRGLGLFLVPRVRRGGGLNYFVRRIKDKIATRSVPTGEVELRAAEAYLLGGVEGGVYRILEVLNVSRIANCVGSVALAQRAYSDALQYAQTRRAFGKAVIEHPLLRRQFEERLRGLRRAFALAWEASRILDEVWQERPPYSERYHAFRLMAHLAKYWTAEFAAQTSKWAMEVHGGIGTLREFGGDRWLRESMILAIWEGTCHRQMLDGLEVMERKGAHKLLLERVAPFVSHERVTEMATRIQALLATSEEEKQASAEEVFGDLAVLVGEALSSASTQPSVAAA